MYQTQHTNTFQGSRVWFGKDENVDGWTPAVVIDASGGKLSLKSDFGEVRF